MTRSPAFDHLALDAFAFLAEMGFKVVERTPTFVRLERGEVFVQLYHGRSSHQVGLELGREAHGQLFSLNEVLVAFAPDLAEQARYQATEPDVLERCLRSVAKTLREQATEVLLGEDAAFLILSQTATKVRRTATLGAQYGAILDQAERAWTDGDRERAAELYEKAEPALDETGRRRLVFVRDKQGL